jgi:bacteriocin-like protein
MEPEKQLTEEELEQVTGGTSAEEGTSNAMESTLMKTKHDTAKNSISNVR